MKTITIALAASSLLASSNIALAAPFPPSQADTYTHQPGRLSYPAQFSTFPVDKNCAGPPVTSPNGVTIACPSSGSTQKSVSEILWVLPVGAVAVLADSGRITTGPLLALFIVGWAANVGVPGAMAAPVYNTTSSLPQPATTAIEGQATNTSIPAPDSRPVVDNKCTGASMVMPDGVTVVCSASSATSLTGEWGAYWALSLGSAGLALALSNSEPSWLLMPLAVAALTFAVPGVLADDASAPTTAGNSTSAYVPAPLTISPATTGLDALSASCTPAAAGFPTAAPKGDETCFGNGTQFGCAGGNALEGKKGSGIYWSPGGGGSSLASRNINLGGIWAILLGSLVVTMGQPRASLALLLLAGAWLQAGLPKVAAADMFVSITPEGGQQTAVYNTTSFALLETSTTALQTSILSSSTVVATPQASATAESMASASEIFSGTLWVIMFGAVVALIAVGRLEAIFLLLLLIGGWTNVGLPRAMSVHSPNADSSTTIKATAFWTTTTTTTTTVTITPAPTYRMYNSSTSDIADIWSSPASRSVALPSTTDFLTTSMSQLRKLTMHELEAGTFAQSELPILNGSVTVVTSGDFKPTAIHVQDACSTVGNLYDCHLPESSVSAVNSAAESWMPSTNLLAGALAAAIAAHVFKPWAVLTLMPFLATAE
ncbi:hypothetical protein LTR85_003085 [Meristemomyces frigidus]|nr:hypothetical protein LTR85_003085 [Meristemomyces frigidus]